MPMYKFTCKDGHVTDEYRPVADYVEYIKCGFKTTRVVAGNKLRSRVTPCGLQADITIDTNLQVHTFKPYTEENITGKPIEITSRDQRDTLLKQHGLSYDSNKYHRKPEYKSAVDDVTLGDVKEALDTGRLPDGTKLDTKLVGTKTTKRR